MLLWSFKDSNKKNQHSQHSWLECSRTCVYFRATKNVPGRGCWTFSSWGDTERGRDMFFHGWYGRYESKMNSLVDWCTHPGTNISLTYGLRTFESMIFRKSEGGICICYLEVRGEKSTLWWQQLMEWDSPLPHPAEKSAPSPTPEAEPQEQEEKA